MWPFTKIYNPNAPKWKITIVNVVVVFVLFIILFQALGVLFGLQGIKLGPVFQLLLIAAIGLAAFAIGKKMIQGAAISKQDIFALVALIVVCGLALFLMRDLIPEVFQQSMLEAKMMLQSFFNIP